MKQQMFSALASLWIIAYGLHATAQSAFAGETMVMPDGSSMQMETPAPISTLQPHQPIFSAQSPMQHSSTQNMNGMPSNHNGVINMYGMSGGEMHMNMGALNPAFMPSTTDIGTPMTREGSGTSWIPDASRIYAHVWARGDDMEMTHGSIFFRYMNTGSPRGRQRSVAPGWFMYMRTHPTSPNTQIGIQAMVTPDALTVGGSGYPELFQTGETWHGNVLHDVQHPHDVVSELALSYAGRLSKYAGAYFYAGYPGEPALGPPAYMHRALAYDYASAPLGHHWQDATHITFGVLTAGLSGTKFKIEESAFTGREPNEIRTNFDPVHLDSSSTRVSWNPNRYVAAQISSGFVKSPEFLDPSINISRTTASILYERPIDGRRLLSQAAVFGQNNVSDGQRTHSLLYEADYHIAENAYFSRIEQVEKTGADLALPNNVSEKYTITALTAGLLHNFTHQPGRSVAGLGADFTYNLKPSSLSPYYGSGNPIGFEIFFRIRPDALPTQDIH